MGKKKAKIFYATGIPGCPRKATMAEEQSISAKNGFKVKIYHLGQMILEFCADAGYPFEPERIQYVDKKIRDFARAGTCERLLRYIDKDIYKYDALGVSAHNVFFRDGIFKPAMNQKYIARIDPEFFVCYIDGAQPILEKLKQRKEWKDQIMKESDVWGWQNEEYNYTYLIAETLEMTTGNKKPVWAIPTGQPAEVLHYLLFEPWRPSAYAKSPMTHLDLEDRKIVFRAFKALRKRFILFDPWAIETGAIEEGDTDEDKIRHAHTKYRDLKWYVRQCKAQIGIYPKVVASPGVEHETKEAIDMGKECFTTWPDEKSSPFHDAMKYIAHDTRELIEYFDTIYLPEYYRELGMEYTPPK